MKNSKKIFDIFGQDEIKATIKNYIKTHYEASFIDENFIIRKSGRIKRLEYFAQDFIDWWDLEIDSNYLRTLISKEIYFKALFKNILEFSNITNKLIGEFQLKPVSHSKVYYIDFKRFQSWEELRKSFSKNIWKNVRHFRNKLRKNYLGYEIIKLNRFDERIFQFIVNNIQKKHKQSIFHNNAFLELQQNILKYLFEKKEVYSWVLLSGHGEILSANYVIERNSYAFSFMVGYELQSDAYRFLIFHMLQNYFEQGFIQFNFMKGESSYKTQWTKDYYKLYRFEFKHPSLLKRITSLII